MFDDAPVRTFAVMTIPDAITGRIERAEALDHVAQQAVEVMDAPLTASGHAHVA